MKPDLIPLEEAVDRVLREARHLGAEPAHLTESYGRVLAEPIRAPFDIPHESASLMDGYAVHASETGPGAALTVAFELPAGRVAPRALAAGECARIFTGAPLPPECDAVVKQEEATRTDAHVLLSRVVAAGEHVRAAGSDARVGAMLLEAGSEMDAGALGLAASVGVGLLSVARRPVVAILATGDELRPVGAPLEPGTIYESNSYGLSVQAREAGGLPALLGRAPDGVDEIVSTLTSTRADIYVTSGGASVGDYDFAQAVLEKLGGRKVFWQVAIRPGKPVLFGVIEGRAPTLFFALPGNPAASALTFDLLVRPAIRRMVGAQQVRRARVKAQLEAPIKKPEGLTLLVRGRLLEDRGRLIFRPAAAQGSMSITSLHGLGAVAIMPAPLKHVETGEFVEVEPWAPLTPA